MSENRSKVPNPYASDEEFLEGFRRTRDGLHAFDAVDLDELTRQGFEAYWQIREERAPVVIHVRDPEAATARLVRKYALDGTLAVSYTMRTIAIGAMIVAGTVGWRWEPLRRFIRSLRRSDVREKEAAEVVTKIVA